MANPRHVNILMQGVDAWNKWRKEVPSIKPDLKGVNLFKRHLEKINLSGAHLEGAILWWSHLEGADLQRAHLEGANLIGAHLEEARLNIAHLEGADLSGAHLEGTSLMLANIDNVNVINVTYSRKTKFKGIRLGTCYGSPMFKRFAQDQEFLEELQMKSWSIPLFKKNIRIPWGKSLYSLWNVTADCGRTPLALLLWSILTPLVFSKIFYDLGREAFNIGYGEWCYKTVLFYSIDNFVSLGIGGMQPVTTAAIIYMTLEGIFGLVMVAGLVSILINMIARRS